MPRTPSPSAAAAWARALASPAGGLGAVLRRLVLALATTKCAAGLAFLILGPTAWALIPEYLIPLWVYPAHVLVFALVAGLLLQAPGGDRRALDLAGVFLCVAVSFSDRMMLGLTQVELAPVAAIGRALDGLHPEAFIAYFLWRFVGEFPRLELFGWPGRIQRAFESISLVTAMTLFAVNLGAAGLEGRALVGFFSRAEGGAGYWLAIMVLSGSALPFMLWKARRTRITERRRVRLFTAGFVLGLAPIVLEIVLEILVPPFFRLIRQPIPFLVAGVVVYSGLLSIPLTTSYAVLVHRALDVRLVVRKAIRYALARNTILAITLAPLAAVGIYLFRHRGEPLAETLGGGRVVLPIVVAAVGWLGLRLRVPLLERLDRRFFREQFDTRRILTELVERSRTVGDLRALAELVEEEVGRALHPETASLLVDAPGGQRLVAPNGGATATLPSRSALVAALAASRTGVEVDLERPETWPAGLSADDRHWLAEGGFRLLVPLLGETPGEVQGALALGDKLSELPYTEEDLELLSSIAASAALALERLLLRASQAPAVAAAAVGPAVPEELVAAECRLCGQIERNGTPRCNLCDGETAPCRLPEVLAGKFELRRRLGAGGMGVVYEGVDLLLERRVAIKTLPRLAPEMAMRLRREARAMARISHPNLALILGAEAWRGTPVLVVELLEGGTLDTRLAEGPLPSSEVVELGIALADVLEHLHGAGILHRDLKPSNIGFTANGQPKLLDFGLARMIGLEGGGPPRAAPPDRSAGPFPASAAAGWTRDRDLVTSEAPTLESPTLEAPALSGATGAGVLVGTPLYMSPEALAAQPPEPSFDLWSLALVLWEAAAGRHPALLQDRAGALDRLRRGELPSLATVRPECPPGLDELLTVALSPRLRRRPRTARELRRRLQRIELEGLTTRAA